MGIYDKMIRNELALIDLIHMIVSGFILVECWSFKTNPLNTSVGHVLYEIKNEV